MSIYKFRVLIEGEKEIFRDIEIKSEQNFEELHKAILAAFNFDHEQMASFYMSDYDWNKGQEISLMDMSMNDDEKVMLMSNTSIKSVINCVGGHLLYTYDFLNMWNFFIELIEINVKEKEGEFPKLVYNQGKAPEQAAKNGVLTDEEIINEILKSEGLDETNFKDNPLSNDEPFDDDIFEGFDDFDDLR